MNATEALTKFVDRATKLREDVCSKIDFSGDDWATDTAEAEGINEAIAIAHQLIGEIHRELETSRNTTPES